MLIQSKFENFKVFFKRRRDFEQKHNIWHFFCNDENIYEVDFRIQTIVCNDDKYWKNDWNSCKVMYIEMRNWYFARKKKYDDELR